MRPELLAEPANQYIAADPLLHCETSSNSNEINQNNEVNNGSTEQLIQSNIITDRESVDTEQIRMPNQTADRPVNETTATTNSTSILSVEKVEPVPLYEACSTNAVELNDLLDDDKVIDKYDEEITFIFKRNTGYGKAMKTDDNGLVKRENDIVTGNMSYNVTVSSLNSLYMIQSILVIHEQYQIFAIYKYTTLDARLDITFFYFVNKIQEIGRIYMLGASKIEIPKRVIDTLTEWNQQKDKSGPDYDKRVISALLLVCVTEDDLAKHNVSKDIRNLIIGKFNELTSRLINFLF